MASRGGEDDSKDGIEDDIADETDNANQTPSGSFPVCYCSSWSEGKQNQSVSMTMCDSPS